MPTAPANPHVMQQYEKARDSMKLPEGKTCADCRHFKRTCEWLIACPPTNVRCDWAPSRFSQIAKDGGVEGEY